MATDMGSVLKWGSLLAFCVQNSCNPLVFRYAMTEADSKHRPSTALVLCFTEMIKFGLSFVLLCQEESWDLVKALKTIHEDAVKKPKASARLGVPAVIYALQNALLQWSSGHLSAAVWQVTYQGKILVTACFSVLLLRKVIKRVQWLAIAIMGLGIAIVQLSNAKEKSQESMANAAEQDVVKGFTMLLLACCCSGFASVYTEMVFKQVGSNTNEKKLSVWLQNMQLAVFSIIVVLLAFAMETMFPKEDGEMIDEGSRDLLHGFTPMQWMLCINNAVGGLLVALVIKHADNILRGFASALATINGAITSVFCFGFELAPSFGLGTLLVLGATLLYGNVLKLPGEWWNSELKLLSVGTLLGEEKAEAGKGGYDPVPLGKVTESQAANPNPSPRRQDAGEQA